VPSDHGHVRDSRPDSDLPTLEQIPDSLLRLVVTDAAEFNWGYTSVAGGGRKVSVSRGKVVGGSSAVNGALALRGVLADYDEWAVLGNADWFWKRALLFFRPLRTIGMSPAPPTEEVAKLYTNDRIGNAGHYGTLPG
jgi:choline dehydrogenase-like flavoprotein